MLKKILSIMLIILFFNTNYAFAENWVTITAENGKSADLDLDSIQMVLDTVEYNIKTENKDYIYINKMSTELYKAGIPTAVIERTQYKNSISEDNQISHENISNRDYRVVKSGTLQAEIFDVLSKELDKKNFTQGKSTWNKYLKRQRKQIYKHWKPQGKYWNTYSEYTSPVYFDETLLIVDKNGIIKNRQYNNSSLPELTVIEPLPEDYTAETFQLGVKMNYYKYAGAKINTKKPVVKQISPVRSEITIAKNKRPPIIGHIELGLLWFHKKVKSIQEWSPEPPDNALVLLEFPLIMVTCLGGLIFEVCTGLLCLISGVSMDDL